MNGGGLARAVAWSAVAGAAVGGVLWFLGVLWPFAVAVAVLAVAFGGAWAGFAGAERPLFVRPAPESRPGTRSEVSQTAWALRGRHGEIGDGGHKRLRTFARSRLRRRGLDLDDPRDAAAIAVLLSARAAVALAAGAHLRIADVEYCLDRLERLEPPPGPDRRGPL